MEEDRIRLRAERNLRSHLVAAIQPLQILPHLHVLTEWDQEEVKCETNNGGPRRGADALLDRLKKKGPRWYPCLLEALRHEEIDLPHLASELEAEVARLQHSSQSTRLGPQQPIAQPPQPPVVSHQNLNHSEYYRGAPGHNPAYQQQQQQYYQPVPGQSPPPYQPQSFPQHLQSPQSAFGNPPPYWETADHQQPHYPLTPAPASSQQQQIQHQPLVSTDPRTAPPQTIYQTSPQPQLQHQAAGAAQTPPVPTDHPFSRPTRHPAVSAQAPLEPAQLPTPSPPASPRQAMATDTQNGAVINGGASRPYNKSTLLGHIGNDIIEALKPLNVPSPVGGDWKKLAGKFDYSVEDVAQLELTSNPLEHLYRDLMSKGYTLGDLVDQLQNLDRQDVLNNVERVTGYIVPKPVTGSGDSGAQGDSNNAINEEDLPVPTFPDESQEQGINQEVDNQQESSAAFGISATEVPPQGYVRPDAESTKNGDEESSAAFAISEAEVPSQPYVRLEFDATKSGDDKEENQDGIESISHSISESDTQPVESLKSASNGKEEVELESEVHPAEETAKQLEESQSQAEPDQPEDSLTLPVEESITNEEELSNMNQEFDIPPIEEANRDETQTSSEVMENPSDVGDEDQDIVILPPEKVVAEVYVDERNQEGDQQMLTRGTEQSEPESALPKEDVEVNPSEAEIDEKGDGKRVENDEEDEKTEVSLNDLAGEVSNVENMRSDIIGEQNPEPELNVTVEDEEKEDNIDPIESEGPETLGEVTNEGKVEEVSSEQSLQAEGPGNEETIADSETKPDLSEVQDSEKTEESIEAESSGIFSSQSMVYALGIIAVVTLLATCMYGVRRIVKK